MEYTATARYIRMSTRKLRLVADAIRKMPVNKALNVLSITPKKGADVFETIIKSAVANAKVKAVNEDNLYISGIEVMGGPVMKRFHAVSRGMAHPYKKRMTHVRVVLAERAVEKQKETKGAK